MRDYADLIDIYEERWSSRPDSYYFLPLANAYRAVGQPGRAIEVLQKGLELHPGYHSARAALAVAYIEADLLEEAEAEARRVIEAQPDNILARKLLVECLRESGKVEEALAELKRLLELAPEDARLQGALEAMESFLAGEAAEVLAEEGAAPEEVFSEILAEKASLLEEPGFEEEDEPAQEVELDELVLVQTEDELEEETEDEPEDEPPLAQMEAAPPEEEAHPARSERPEPTATLAELYADQGHTEEAVAVYRQLVKKEPSVEHYRRRLEELEEEMAVEHVEAPQPSREAAGESLEGLLDDSAAVEEIHGLFTPPTPPEEEPSAEVVAILEGWLDTIKRRKGPEPPTVDIT